MRGSLGCCLAGLSILTACHDRPAPAAPAAASASVQNIPLAPLPEEPAPLAPRVVKTSSIVDDDHPHTFDGARKNPGMATLRGVNAHEAWVAFNVVGGPGYDAIVDLDTGCVSETFEAVSVDAILRRAAGTSDQDILGALRSEDAQRELGAHLARLGRFEQQDVGAVMVRRHGDGQMAVSDDHRKIALVLLGRVFVSLDGGRSFTRADRGGAGTIDGLQLGGGDRYVIYRTYGPRPSRGQLAVLDLTGELPASLVDLEHFIPLQASSPEGLLLFSHETDRCLYGVDPAAPALKQLSCVPGPKITKDHFFYVHISPSGRMGVEIQGDFQATRGIVFTVDGSAKPRRLKGAFDLHNLSVGPDDEGRFAWETRLGVLRIDSPSGVQDARMSGGSPLGFDLQGSVVVFQQPPLVRPHQPMTMMPPAKGTLADTRCTLVRRAGAK